MMIETPIPLETVYRGMAMLVAIWACVSSLENLAVYDRYRGVGLMNWRIMKVYFGKNRFSRIFNPFLDVSGFRYVLFARFGLGVVLGAAAVLDALHPVLFLLLFVTDVSILYRSVVGLSGAYHMVMLVDASLFLLTLYPEGSNVHLAAMLFLGVQGVLSYFVSGLLKIVAEPWQNGTGVRGVFGTYTFGNAWIHELLQRVPKLGFVASWTVVLFECLFVLVLVVPPEWTIFFFAAAFLFHLFNAVFMGLNGFVIIFPASYFPIYYANLWLHHTFL